MTGAAAIAKSDDPATSLKLCTTVPVRLFRLSVTAATIAFGIFKSISHHYPGIHLHQLLHVSSLMLRPAKTTTITIILAFIISYIHNTKVSSLPSLETVFP
ncbi:hypothetical protein L2E82_24555 [Cichorium intybus]|uniref:Uncharacterized protein n=1 Tax=Cichorium intybus TaxID=13427 RepID=A0ACB9E190_CICIN|nr:hypothetical protein L2E82_24555 [Cichorium intybus]